MALLQMLASNKTNFAVILILIILIIYNTYNIRLCKSKSDDTCPGNNLIHTIEYNTSVIESAFNYDHI